MDARRAPGDRNVGVTTRSPPESGRPLPSGDLSVVSTNAHLGGEVMNNPVIFGVYDHDDAWIASHLGRSMLAVASSVAESATP